MKDIQRKFISIDAYPIKKTLLLLKTEGFEGFKGEDKGFGLASVQIPPERTGL
jgi:hypothetical protein